MSFISGNTISRMLMKEKDMEKKLAAAEKALQSQKKLGEQLRDRSVKALQEQDKLQAEVSNLCEKLRQEKEWSVQSESIFQEANSKLAVVLEETKGRLKESERVNEEILLEMQIMASNSRNREAFIGVLETKIEARRAELDALILREVTKSMRK